MVRDDGETLSEKFGVVTTSATVVEWVIAAESVPTPVIVRVYVPAGVLLTVAIDSAGDAPGVAGFGLKVALAPEGNPLTEKFTGELYPFLPVSDSV
jgi:hypothetical protein